jgi:hypothetical protein
MNPLIFDSKVNHEHLQEAANDERYNIVPYNQKGTGEGSDVEISFDPDAYIRSRCDKGGVESTDVVLFHEMVHALRKMQGKQNHIPTENPLLDNDEEFLAIVIANMYISSQGGHQFRDNHHGYKPLAPPLNTSKGFVDDAANFKLLINYKRLWPETIVWLGLVPAFFNPFRELILNRDR